MNYFIENIEKYMKRSLMFHLNDSVNDYIEGKKGVDRHEVIGKGKIKKEIFETIIKNAYKK